MNRLRCKTALWACFLALAHCSPAPAQHLTGIAGSFVSLPITARTAALQNTSGALSDEAAAIHTNPAALVQANNTGFAFTYFRVFGILPVISASSQFALSTGSALGIALVTTGDELYRENTLRVGAARVYVVQGCQMDVGASVDIRYASFGNSASSTGNVSGEAWGFGVSAGARCWLLPELVVALSVRDLVGQLVWNSSASGKYSEAVPPSLVAGIGVIPEENTSLGFDLRKSLTRDIGDRICISAERTLFDVVRLRASYAMFASGEPVSSWAVGFGVSHRLQNGLKTRLDLSYSVQDLPNTLRATLQVWLP